MIHLFSIFHCILILLCNSVVLGIFKRQYLTCILFCTIARTSMFVSLSVTNSVSFSLCAFSRYFMDSLFLPLSSFLSLYVCLTLSFSLFIRFCLCLCLSVSLSGPNSVSSLIDSFIESRSLPLFLSLSFYICLSLGLSDSLILPLYLFLSLPLSLSLSLSVPNSVSFSLCLFYHSKNSKIERPEL